MSIDLKNLLRWYDRTARELPWRTYWQTHRDPWGVWLSEIMLQQTLVSVVVPAFSRVLAQYLDVRAFAAADPEQLRLAFRGLGYYRRFDLLHRGARVLATSSTKIAWPTTREGWAELPGIGPYTSAALASICNDELVGVVDGNVERVLCRVFDWREEIGTPSLKKKCQKIVDTWIAQEGARARPGDFNQALMQIGQLLCTPQEPVCDACPMAKGCLARERRTQSLAPKVKVRREPVDVTLELEILTRGARAALVQRGDGSKFLRGSWGFPMQEKTSRSSTGRTNLGTVRHSITHHRITAKVMTREVSSKQPRIATASNETKWLPHREVESALLSNLDRKAWRLFERSVRTRKSSEG